MILLCYHYSNEFVVKMRWVSPHTITGSPAENEKYLRREYINEEFWEYVGAGKHILFTAPRRIGKSSVMKDLEKTCPDGVLAIYEDIESDKNQHEFFKRLFELLVERLGKKGKLKRLAGWLKSKSIGEVSPDGRVKFIEKQRDYKSELLELIKEMGSEQLKVVMLLDEFPDVLQSILDNDGKKAAVDTLHTLREIRHTSEFKNFTLVFAGSIGLEHVVAKVDGRLKLINDLEPIQIDQLDPEEAKDLIHQLLEGASMTISEEVMDYMLEKINYLLPYFVQLMLDKTNRVLRKKRQTELTEEDVDTAFELVVKEGRNFGDWEKRLTDYLSKMDAEFCIGMLTRYAHDPEYLLQKALNYSVKVKPDTHYKELLDDVLVKDGYLAREGQKYRFQSPFLREWWKVRYPAIGIDD